MGKPNSYAENAWEQTRGNWVSKLYLGTTFADVSYVFGLAPHRASQARLITLPVYGLTNHSEAIVSQRDRCRLYSVSDWGRTGFTLIRIQLQGNSCGKPDAGGLHFVKLKSPEVY